VNIQAVTDKTFDIQAALQHPEVRGVSRILAKAGIAKPTARFKATELEAALANSDLSTEQRIGAKLALDRAGLVDWNA
jgi:hypothetical protein